MPQQLSLDLLFTSPTSDKLSTEGLKLWLEQLPSRTRVGYRQRKGEKQCFVTTFDRNDKESLSVVIKISSNCLESMMIIEGGSISSTYKEVNKETLELVYKWIVKIV